MATRNPVRRPSGLSRVVAIDIGTDSVHAVEVQFAPDARIVKRGTVKLSSPMWEDLAVHKDALAQAIKSAMSAGGISATQVVTAIPRRMVTLKYARLPHAEPELIRGMVEFEAQQYVPFPLEEVVLGHQVVSDEMDEMTTVMIVAARLSLVETLLSIFDRAGLEVTHVSVSALALAEHARGAALPVALLEADGPELDMAVVSADKLLFSRAASMNSSRAVAISPAEQLSAEIARSLAAYQNEHRASPLSRILIAGQGDDLTEVQEALVGLLDIPVGPLTSPMLPAADPTASTYAVAAGLALQAGGGGISTIDLVPSSRLERKVQARQRTHTAVAVIAVAAALTLAVMFISRTISDQAREAQAAVTANRNLDQANTDLAKVKTEYDRVRKSYEVVAGGMGRTKPMVDIVKAVSDALPKGGGIYLTQLAFERGTQLSIHGNAANETAATDLVISLQGSGAFKDVVLNYLGDNSTESMGGPGARTPAKPGGGSQAPKTSGLSAPGARNPGGGTTATVGNTTPGRSGGTARGTPFNAATAAAAAAAPADSGSAKDNPAAMSFLVTCKVLGSEQKDIGDKPPTTKRTTTATVASDGRTP